MLYTSQEYQQRGSSIRKKTMHISSMVLLFFTLIFLWRFPSAAIFLTLTSLVISLALASSFIFKKHKQSENSRLKIIKEILVLLLTILLAMFLGGMVGMYANHYVTQRFGIIAGILSALAVSFAAGHTVYWGIGKTISRSEKQFSPR